MGRLPAQQPTKSCTPLYPRVQSLMSGCKTDRREAFHTSGWITCAVSLAGLLTSLDTGYAIIISEGYGCQRLSTCCGSRLS